MNLKPYLFLGIILGMASCGDGKKKDENCSESVLQNYSNDAKALVDKPSPHRKKFCDDMVRKYEQYDGCKIPMNVIFTDASGTIGVREFLIKTLKDACNKM